MKDNNSNIAIFFLLMHRILIYIRSNIQDTRCIELIKALRKYTFLSIENMPIDLKVFKSEIIEASNVKDENSSFLLNAINNSLGNVDTNNIVEVNKYLIVIYDALEEVLVQLNNKNFDRVYDLVDAIHCLPEALLEKKTWNSKDYWKTYIKPYRLKWNNNFLQQREKEVVKSSLLDRFLG